MDNTSFTKELIKRLRIRSLPDFFIKVRAIGGTIAAIGAGIKLMTTQITDSKLLDFLAPYAVELIVAGGVMALFAQSTTKPEVPNKELTKNTDNEKV